MKHKGFLLDTSAVNRAVDGKLDLDALSAQGAVFATPHQTRELMATPADSRRNRLVGEFVAYDVMELHTATAGAQTCSEADVPMHWAFPEAIAAELDKQQPKRAAQNWTDSLLLDCARRNGLVLVTADRRLADLACDAGVAFQRVP